MGRVKNHYHDEICAAEYDDEECFMANPEWTDPDSWEDYPTCEVCGAELDEDGECSGHKGTPLIQRTIKQPGEYELIHGKLVKVGKS